ncbi:MAG: TRAP transporter small permease subunit [Alphaproteobacteria bacterium]|nr:TRAP transporter small permease subunit [Alphaproteobacteria bacterium]
MPRALLRLSARIDAFTGALGRGVAWLTALMVFIGAANAVLRYAGRFVGQNLTSNATLEMQWYLFSAVFLLGAAAALKDDAHVRVDVFYGRLSPRGKAAIDLAGTLLFLLPFCGFALWVSYPSVAASVRVWEMSPDPGGLPRWPIKALILASFWLLLFQGLSEAIKKADLLLRGAPEEAP